MPSPSVTTVRTFSMSTGLAASTVTPGTMAPVASLTTPAMVPLFCAKLAVGSSSTRAAGMHFGMSDRRRPRDVLTIPGTSFDSCRDERLPLGHRTDVPAREAYKVATIKPARQPRNRPSAVYLTGGGPIVVSDDRCLILNLQPFGVLTRVSSYLEYV